MTVKSRPLLENTISLQNTLTNLASELKTLNKKVSSLLQLFERASKSFGEAKSKGVRGAVSGELSEKVDELVKQNRTIAKGLLLLEKSMRGDKPERILKIRPRKKIRKPERKFEEPELEEEEYKPEPLPEFSF